MSAADELSPLQGLLENILARISKLESEGGIEGIPLPSVSTSRSSLVSPKQETPRSLIAYDEYIETSLKPFVLSCNEIPGLKNMGSLIQDAFNGIRTLIHLGSVSKKPADLATVLVPYLKPTQNAITSIQKLRLDRNYDFHYKAIVEMLVCCSWPIAVPPSPSTPIFVKQTVGSSDFWANKIRKEFKNKDETQIVFCDNMKKVILNLADYVKEFHLSGLAFNPRGSPVENYKLEVKEEVQKIECDGAAGLLDELANKRTKDGDSAATGLKKVTREQQSWRKEFKKDPALLPTPTSKSPATQPIKQKMATKEVKPIFELQQRTHKWIIENQTKENNPSGSLTVNVTDPKQQAYIYKCSNTTITFKGKIKTIILDSCTKTNVLFDTVISACEIVNCQRVQVQTFGTCPTFSIDKTDGCLIFLSKESLGVSSFVTSKSSEMNVNWADENGEVKEVPIPEQFHHKLVNGGLKTQTSDLYH